MTRHLILIPTGFELRHAAELSCLQSDRIVIEICGFGPVASAARTAFLLSQLKPQKVTIVGIAGSLDDGLPIGSAWQFSSVAMYGVGAGSGASFKTAEQLGWHHWSEEPTIGDRIRLSELDKSLTVTQLADSKEVAVEHEMLSVCAASSDERDRELRKQQFPLAMAEDMESFSVALACALAHVPLQIVRGISNRAGDRDHRNWKVSEAMTAAVRLVKETIPA